MGCWLLQRFYSLLYLVGSLARSSNPLSICPIGDCLACCCGYTRGLEVVAFISAQQKNPEKYDPHDRAKAAGRS